MKVIRAENLVKTLRGSLPKAKGSTRNFSQDFIKAGKFVCAGTVRHSGEVKLPDDAGQWDALI